MSFNIEQLNIEVSASADKAEKSLDKLIATLEQLKARTASIKGFDKLTTQLDKLGGFSAKIQSMTDSSGKIERFVNSINKLNNIQVPNLTKLNNATDRLVQISSAISTVQIDTSKIESISNAFKPFENLGKNNLNSFLNSIKRFPEAAEALKKVDISSFADSMNKVNQAIVPLANNLEKVGNGFNKLPANIQRVISQTQEISPANNSASNSYNILGRSVKAFKVHLFAGYYVAKRVFGVLSEFLDESNDYIENLNLFTVAMGNSSKAALEYAESVNNALGIDVSEFIRNQGVFKQITSGFGVVEEKANLMSKNLTQIGYDMSSFFNIDIEEAMQKVQSGISGELEPLRRLGYALDTATLQQVAYRNGINQSLNSMTQAQKSQLRYIAIMEQSTNVMGDMARTIITPANSIRVMDQLITQFKRSLGNIYSVLAVKVIPYLQVFIKLLTEGANYLAKKWGFEMPEIDYSSVSNGLSSATDDADDFAESTNEAVKAIQRLAGFDELNILSSGDSSSSVDTGTSGNYDLNIDLPEYDFLQGLDSSTDKLYQKIKSNLKDFLDKLKDIKKKLKENKDIVKLIAEIIGAVFVAKKISPFVESLGEMTKKLSGSNEELSKMTKIKIVTFTSALSALVGIDFGKHLADESLTAKNAVMDIGAYVGAIGFAFATTGPVGAAVTAVSGFVGLIGELAWEIYDAKKAAEEAEEQYYRVKYLFDGFGVPLEDVLSVYSNFVDKFEQRTASYKELSDEIDSIQASIDDAAERFSTTFNKFKLSPETIGEADFEALKAALDDLYSYTKEIVDKEVNLIVKGIKESFGSLANEMASSDLAAQFYLLGADMNQALADSQKKADELMNKLYEMKKKGNTSGSEWNNTLNQLNEEVSKIAIISSDDADYVADFKSFSKMLYDDYGKIDLENEEALGDFLTELQSQYELAASGIDEVLKSQISTLNKFRGQLGDLGIEYDSSIFDDAEEQFKRNRNALLSELQGQTKAITGQINVQIDTAWDGIYNEKLTDILEEKGYYDYLDQLKWLSQNAPDDTYTYDYIKSRIKLIEDDMSDYETQAREYANGIVSNSIEKLRMLPSELIGNQYDAKRLSWDSERELKKLENAKKDLSQNFGFSQNLVKGQFKVGYSAADNLIKGFTTGLQAANQNNFFPSNFAMSGGTTKMLGVNGSFLGSVLLNGTISQLISSGISVANGIGTMFDSGKNQSNSLVGITGSNIGTSFINSVKSLISGSSSSIANGISAMITNSKNLSNSNVSSAGSSSGSAFVSGLRTKISSSNSTISSALQGIANGLPLALSSQFSKAGESVGDTFSSSFLKTTNKIISSVYNLLPESAKKAFNQQYKLATGADFKVGAYASGGMPKTGDFFIANENGPELIGKIGNRSAVANDNQISESIKQGVREALAESGSYQTESGDTYIFLDSDCIAYSMEKRRRSELVKSNGRS